jgi:hypothetical protein
MKILVTLFVAVFFVACAQVAPKKCSESKPVVVSRQMVKEVVVGPGGDIISVTRPIKASDLVEMKASVAKSKVVKPAKAKAKAKVKAVKVN